MVAAFIWVPVLFFLVITQKTLVDALTLHRVNVDLALAFVVFAGFFMSVSRGGVLVLCAGFLVAVLSGSMTTLFMLVYLIIFGLAMMVSTQVYVERPVLIVAFTAFCALLEGAMLGCLKYYFLDAPRILPTFQEFLPQAFILGPLTPPLFRLFRKIEAFVHA
jgi:hypothetical protein